MHCTHRFVVVVLWALLSLAPTFGAPGEFVWQKLPEGRMASVQPRGNSQPGFTSLSASQTGITFSNSVEDAIVPPNQNFLLGSGVAVGDVDDDGWCDLYLCALKSGNALYRNRGGWRFEDITETAGVALREGTNTGAAFADVDGDNDLDLLVSSLGRGVRLFRNELAGKYREVTAEAGLASRTGSTSMALGDVDGDGDLDLFVCNYGAQPVLRSGVLLNVRMVNGQPELREPHPRLQIVNGKLVELGEPSTLYLNEGRGIFRPAPWNSVRFRDEDGRPMPAPWDFSLSAQMRDVNGDGAPDIYVCNDFDTPDRFWLNDGRGNFRLAPRRALRCQSYASMGVDFADIDRDGHLDFFVVEMLAMERVRRLTQTSPMFSLELTPAAWTYRPEIARNVLYRGRGDGTFAEIANYAGVAASDWSWQGSFLDVDIDGYEDVLVANGDLFDVHNLDVPAPRSFSVADRHAQLLATPRLFTPNVAWRNRGDLTFEDRSAAWGFNDTNISHGMAFADFDNDGDLDVALNCMNAPALLLRSDSDKPRVSVRLKGTAPNTRGIGAKVTLRGGAVPVQTQEIISGGKYLSCDEASRVFAASPTNAMTIEVLWRSGTRSVMTNVQANAIYEIAETNSHLAPRPSHLTNVGPWFVDEGARLNHQHAEAPFNDFAVQPLLPRKLSQRGPGVCVTDLDDDGHDDLVIGAGRGGRVSFHKGDGADGFQPAAVSEPVPEDVLALVEWTSSAGRGVLCTLARYESATDHPPLLLLMLEKNELTFHTVAAPGMFPKARSVGHSLAVADYDGDGDLDVFLGSHAIAGRYPEAAPSMLLVNDRGRLRNDATNSAALAEVGLVNSALWSDLNDDGWPELILACEWGPLRIFKNVRGELTAWNAPLSALKSQSSTLNHLTGLWTGVVAADFDNDGRVDLVAGNWGLNGAERATVSQPLRLYYADCLRRGTLDLFEADYDGDGVEPRPARPLSELASAVPLLSPRYRNHQEWATTEMQTALASFGNPRAVAATTLASTLFLNRGDHFEARPLPREAQWAPTWSMVASDFNGDGFDDLYLAQNFSATRPGAAALSSGEGLLLRGNGDGSFQSLSAKGSGISIDGDQRGAAMIDFDEDGRPDLVAAQNGERTCILRNTTGSPALRVRLSDGPLNPNGLGAVARWEREGKVLARREIHGGSGWLSHSGSLALMPAPTGTNTQLHVRWPGGRETRTAISPAARAVTLNHRGTVTVR
jgi:hypothetical protein